MLADLRELIPALTTGEEKQPESPIPGYDDLNAGQIVARLSDLTQRDLATTLAYERAHRNRRAVVERAQALTTTEPWPGYDDLATSQVLERINTSSATAVRDYESRHRRRVAILEAAQSQLSET
jgi:hypothetical protein